MKANQKFPIPVDEGWAWVGLFASFLACYITGGICFSMGTYFPYYLTLYAPIQSALLASLPGALILLLGTFSQQLAHHRGYTTTFFIGSVIGSLGFAISFATQNVYVLLLTQGVIVGVGAGLIFTAAISINKVVFDEKFILANALALSGVSVGCLTFPILISKCIERFGIQGSHLILSAIFLHVCISGVLVIRIPTPKYNILPDIINDATVEIPQIELPDTNTQYESIKNGKRISKSFIMFPDTQDIVLISSQKLWEDGTTDPEEQSKIDGTIALNEANKYNERNTPPLKEALSSKPSLSGSETSTSSIDSTDKMMPQNTTDNRQTSEYVALNMPPNGTIQSALKHKLDRPLPKHNSLIRASLESLTALVNESITYMRLRHWKNAVFLVSCLFWQLGSNIMYFMIAAYGKRAGLSGLASAALISSIGLGDLTGRVLITIWGMVEMSRTKNLSRIKTKEHKLPENSEVSNHYHSNSVNVTAQTKLQGALIRRAAQSFLMKIGFYLASLFIHTLVSILYISYQTSNFTYLSGLAFLFGVFFGVRITVTSNLVADMFGPTKFFRAYGIVMVACGLGGLVGSPFSSWISARFGKPVIMFYINIIAFGIAFIISVVCFATKIKQLRTLAKK